MDGFGLFGMTGEEIYRNFIEGRGADDLAEAALRWKTLQDKHVEIAERARALSVRMESAWQGDAAGAAQRGALPIAIEHEQAAPLLFTSHDLFRRQADSFNDARNAVVPVPPAPDRPSGFEILFSPGKLMTYEQKLADHSTAAQRNVDVMSGYESASTYNADNLPTAYGALTPDSTGITLAPPADGGPGQGGEPGSPSGPRTHNDSGPRTEMSWSPHTESGGSQPGSPGAGPPSPRPDGNGGNPPQDTNMDRYVPPPSPVPNTEPGPPGLRPGPAGGPPPVVGLAPVGGRPAGGGAPGGSGGAGSPGARGSGGVADRYAGGRPGGEPGHGSGGRTGTGPVAGGAAAEAAARGAAGARGVAAGGVPMGVGAGRRPGDEDIERKAPKYLEEPDPEGTFGMDEVTAPPVLGAPEDEPA